MYIEDRRSNFEHISFLNILILKKAAAIVKCMFIYLSIFTQKDSY